MLCLSSVYSQWSEFVDSANETLPWYMFASPISKIEGLYTLYLNLFPQYSSLPPCFIQESSPSEPGPLSKQRSKSCHHVADTGYSEICSPDRVAFKVGEPFVFRIALHIA